MSATVILQSVLTEWCSSALPIRRFSDAVIYPDGSEGEMCGNALRSVGKYVYDHRLTDKKNVVIETLGGMQHLTLTVEDGFGL